MKNIEDIEVRYAVCILCNKLRPKAEMWPTKIIVDGMWMDDLNKWACKTCWEDLVDIHITGSFKNNLWSS